MDRWTDSDADWKQFQQSLLKQIPLVGGDLQATNIDRFVKQAIKKFMPKSLANQDGLETLFSRGFDFELFETHRSIFIRCRMPKQTSAEDVKLFVNRRKLKIDDGKQEEEIPLPSDIQPSRATARLDDGVLEIRLPKWADNEPYREIFIRNRRH